MAVDEHCEVQVIPAREAGHAARALGLADEIGTIAPGKRAEFIMSEMRQGLDTIKNVEEETQLDEFGG